ncbi:MAG TPA: hypothetical protein VF220_05390 [Nitrososphaeraceae archaeon]
MSFLKYIAITSVTIATLSVLIHGGAFGMYEDQVEICNFENNCQIVNIDDYMNKHASDKLQNNFDNNLDTYSKIQALDTECRDNYYSFCFGEAWNSLKEYLN